MIHEHSPNSWLNINLIQIAKSLMTVFMCLCGWIIEVWVANTYYIYLILILQLEFLSREHLNYEHLDREQLCNREFITQ